jgi:hypothetical protein
VADPEFTLVGLQAKPATTAATRLKVVLWDAPFRVAVTVTLWFVAKAPAVAVKVAEVAPAGTVTAAGTVSKALLSHSVTVVAEEAAWLRVTVQVVETLGAKTPGLQFNDVNPMAVVIVPPVAVVGIALPVARVLTALVTLMVVPRLVADIVTVRTATTPFLMRFAFSPPEPRPVRKHM